MKLRTSGKKIVHVAIAGAVLAAATAFSGCEQLDTTVAVNISSTDDVGVVGALNLTISQGANVFATTLTPPVQTEKIVSEEMEGMPATTSTVYSIENDFFERITLDESWSEEEAIVSVSASDDRGQSFADTATIEIVHNGAVAAFVELALPDPEAEGAGGDANASPTGSTTSTGTTTSSATAAPTQSSTGDPADMMGAGGAAG